jgi:hypothetical protein
MAPDVGVVPETVVAVAVVGIDQHIPCLRDPLELLCSVALVAHVRVMCLDLLPVGLLDRLRVGVRVDTEGAVERLGHANT